MSTVVIKFGGSSVASRAGWDNILSILRSARLQQYKIVIVCSAPRGITPLLDTLAHAGNQKEIMSGLMQIQRAFEVLSEALALPPNDMLQCDINALSEILLDHATELPRAHRTIAEVMAYGELILTKIAALFLQQNGLSVHWQDVRAWLKSADDPEAHVRAQMLNAQCDMLPKPSLQQALSALKERLVITQGFIAQNSQGQTVLLGRGGSDTSCAYLAAQLQAEFCEIWTDVPGVFTARPDLIPSARVIPQLGYDEAEEIAAMGGSVLHPRSIGPLRLAHIPLRIASTFEPELPGTLVGNASADETSMIKAVLVKSDVVLITVDTMLMWHQVGFLSKVFDCFKRHGISIDLISTSESSISVTLDTSFDATKKNVIDALLDDLNQFASAKVIAACASVSLVGRNIRAILHKLGTVMTVFEEQKVYLVSQAANDLNFTFVLDQKVAARVARELHHLLIQPAEINPNAVDTWLPGMSQSLSTPWWLQKKEELLQIAQSQSPCFVYSRSFIQSTLEALKNCDAVDQFFYSIKANYHPEILQLIYDAGFGFECVSAAELRHIFALFPTIAPKRISFTPNFASSHEYAFAFSKNTWVTVDNIYPLSAWAELFKDRSLLLRLDVGLGNGHHKYVVTNGDQSKFGIPLVDLPVLLDLVEQHNIEVVGLHCHSGSGILTPEHWQQVFERLVEYKPLFQSLIIINVGGGLGVIERNGQAPLDLSVLNQAMRRAKAQYPDCHLWMEPGRYICANAGVLLTAVTQTKTKADRHFVGVDVGMNTLIRPALYGAHHEIYNLSQWSMPLSERADVVGPICETGDTLGYARALPVCKEGDVLLIATAGAYGRAMSSSYNLRPPAQEYIID